MKSPFLAATPLLAALLWTISLIVDGEPWTPTSVLLIGIGLLTTATVGTVGIILSGGRWSRRTALGALAFSLVVAVVRDVDVWWWIGLIASVSALLALMSPPLTASIRKLPAATGPSPRAIAPALLLLAAPAILGFFANDATPWAATVVGVSAPGFAFLYSRVIPGGLLGIRITWPVIAVVLSPLLGWTAGVVTLSLALTLVVISWGPSVKASFYPPVEQGTTFPIPPELAPSEILDAARIDDQGRPL